MRLGPGKWRILIEGKDNLPPQWRHGFDYLILRLFGGEEVADDALKHYEVTVRPLTDRDEVISVPEE